MKRLGRRTLYTQQESDNVRLNQLERRIPDDYPHMFSTALADNSVGPGTGTTNFGFSSPYGDPTDKAFDFLFIAGSDDYLYLPSAFGGQFEVTLQAATNEGSSLNYLQPVSAGNTTPSNQILIRFIPYLAVDGVVDTGSFTQASVFVQNTQEPPPSRGGGYTRIWSHYRVCGANDAMEGDPTLRWALLPFIDVTTALGGAITITGLVMSVKLLPPGGVFGTATWAG